MDEGGDDVLDGSRTSIRLSASGGSGNDRLLGGTNSDSFEGGSGDDVLAGFLGGDIYTFDIQADRNLGRDRIVEIAARGAGANQLDLKGSTYSDCQVPGGRIGHQLSSGNLAAVEACAL